MDALVTCTSHTGEHSAEVRKVPIPEPAPNELLLKVHSVALNPIDALYAVHPICGDGRVIGSDIAGVVEQVGKQVLGWKVGDRAATFLQGACSTNALAGGFAEYAVTPFDLAFHVPSGVSFDEAATVPLCALTAAQVLYYRLGIPAPFDTLEIDIHGPALKSTADSPAILIYGAATSIGMYAVQLAKLARTSAGIPYRVYATASAKNHTMLRNLGVDYVADYRNSEWPEHVIKASGGISCALDCISEGSTTGSVSKTFVEGGGRIAVLRSNTWNKDLVRKDVECIYGEVWTGLGVEFTKKDVVHPPSPSERALFAAFYRFLSVGAPGNPAHLPIQPNPVRLMPGGLPEIVTDGFELLGSAMIDGREAGIRREEPHMRPISAEKLVYRV